MRNQFISIHQPTKCFWQIHRGETDRPAWMFCITHVHMPRMPCTSRPLAADIPPVQTFSTVELQFSRSINMARHLPEGRANTPQFGKSIAKKGSTKPLANIIHGVKTLLIREGNREMKGKRRKRTTGSEARTPIARTKARRTTSTNVLHLGGYDGRK